MEYYITYNFHAYSPKNTKHAEMVEIARKFEHIIIEGKAGYDAFVFSIRHEMDKLNEKYSKQKPMQFYKSLDENGCIKVYFQSPDINTDKEQTVFYMTVTKVRGVFSFSENKPSDKILLPNRCCECGCTDYNPCYHPEHGACFWLDDEHTLCSHCGIEEIKNDSATEHPFDDLMLKGVDVANSKTATTAEKDAIFGDIMREFVTKFRDKV